MANANIYYFLQTKVTLLGTKYVFTLIGEINDTFVSINLNEVSWLNWPSLDAIVLKIEYAATEWVILIILFKFLIIN